MQIDLSKMYAGLMQRFNAVKNEKGVVKANDIANAVLPYANATSVNKIASIFTQAAAIDGNNELSQAEFQKAISSEQFKNVVQEHADAQNELFAKSKDPSDIKGPDRMTGTPRDHVVAQHGEYFAKEVWDPMKKLADEALKYMQENNGSLEKFSFTGFPHGVKIQSVAPLMNYTNTSNDTMSIVDGQPQVTRHSDSVQAMVIFEYQGEIYRVASDNSTDNLAPWRNPSYTEEN